uniref:Uncharacterized protein n=1 Tax=Dictyoglomus turgidum TaxID=513050 RepID=A0A7C3SN88_9BACT
MENKTDFNSYDLTEKEVDYFFAACSRETPDSLPESRWREFIILSVVESICGKDFAQGIFQALEDHFEREKEIYFERRDQE